MILNYQDLDKKKGGSKNNNTLATAAGRQRFQHISHVRLAKSDVSSRKRQFQDSATNQLLFTGSKEASQAELLLKTLEGTKKKLKQPGTDQGPWSLLGPVKHKLHLVWSHQAAKVWRGEKTMTGDSKQLEGVNVCLDACLSLCGPAMNFPPRATVVTDRQRWRTSGRKQILRTGTCSSQL